MEYLFGVFILLGVLDKVTGNHFKLGEEFDKGIKTAGSLILSMVGMIVLSRFIANDAGGAALAYELSDASLWAGYNGMIVASMLGAAILLIPMALGWWIKCIMKISLTEFSAE